MFNQVPVQKSLDSPLRLFKITVCALLIKLLVAENRNHVLLVMDFCAH